MSAREMSPTEPHVYLNLDDVQSLFSDELSSSQPEGDTCASAVPTNQSCRSVHPFMLSAKLFFFFKESRHARANV